MFSNSRLAQKTKSKGRLEVHALLSNPIPKPEHKFYSPLHSEQSKKQNIISYKVNSVQKQSHPLRKISSLPNSRSLKPEKILSMSPDCCDKNPSAAPLRHRWAWGLSVISCPTPSVRRASTKYSSVNRDPQESKDFRDSPTCSQERRFWVLQTTS